MHIRFRRTLRIAPGVKINLSKHGVSTTVGSRGMHLTFNKYGVRQAVGLPGTGLSEVGYLVGGHKGTRSEKPQSEKSESEKPEEEAARHVQSIHHGEGFHFEIPGLGCLVLVLLIVGAVIFFGAEALKLHPASTITDWFNPLWHSLTVWVKKAGF